MRDIHSQQQCPPNTIRYYIQAGDTLYGLARRYGTTVAAILAANPGLNPDTLQIGQNICIPLQPIYPSCPGGKYYVVKRGDTLYAIARSNGVSLSDLTAANPLVNPTALAIGQVLCIPSPVAPACLPGTAPYTVKAGDTMYSIAVSHHIDVYAVMKANPNVDPTKLQIGQVLCIPGAAV